MLDEYSSLTMTNFTFEGNINLNFFTFKDLTGLSIQNITMRIYSDVYGYIFNGMNDNSKESKKLDMTFSQVKLRTTSRGTRVQFNGGVFHIR